MLPIFSDRLELGVIEKKGAIFSFEDEYVIHLGPLSTEGYPLIDGTRTLDQLTDQLSNHIPASNICLSLEQLTKGGFLEWHTVPNGGNTEHGDCELSETLERWKQLYGIEVIAANDYLHPSILSEGHMRWKTGDPHLFVKPYGRFPYIGPFVIPDETPCFSCLHHRLYANRPDRIFLHEQKSELNYYKPGILGLSLEALQRIEQELCLWRESRKSRVAGQVLRLDLETDDESFHPITKRPQCPICGSGPERTHPPPISISQTSSYRKLGTGYRTRSASDTLKNYRHLIDPLTGIVRRFDRITEGAGSFIHAYKVFHPSRLSNYTFEYLKSNLYPPSGGKGSTVTEAQTSALCEAIERYSGIHHNDEYSIKGTYYDLDRQAIDPNDCMLFSEDQYLSRTTWNSHTPHFFHNVPEAIDRKAAISWSPLWTLTERMFKYLPTAYCYFSYDGPGGAYCRADSNGHAAGNTLEEALLQGFLELVERDGVAIWWYNRLIRPAVDILSFNHPYFEELLHHYATIGREVWLLDLTTDLGIPVFVAVSRSLYSSTENIVFGFGAHLDAEIAAMRALTEINQVLPGAEAPHSIQRRASHSQEASSFIKWLAQVNIREHLFLAPAPGPHRTSVDLARWEGDSLHDALMHCLERASVCGIEVLALNQTRADIGLPVVKVVAPGLRHFWKRWGPGRMYDVPVDMGWLAEKKTESQLNPIPLSY